MNVDDILYLGLLVFSMAFGLFYRKIEDVEKKKIIGGIVGLAIVTAVSGVHVLHVLVTTSVVAGIIVFGDKTKCHVHTFIFCFLYLFFFRSTVFFNIPYAPSHTNLVQMMLTLKLIGLAFEVNKSVDLKRNKKEKSNDSDEKVAKTEEEQLDEERCKIDVTLLDVFCYTFNYCGVLTGPYFRYRTFLDHLYKPYHRYDNFKNALTQRMFWLPIVGLIHVLTNYYWPLSYVNTDEFLDRPFLYRYWYIWPSFLIFRSRIYFGLMLTEVVCIFGGLGVYPAFTKPKSGHGPTENFKQLKEVSEEQLKTLQYDYETIRCIDVFDTEFCTTMREAMKHWNITIQYWLANYVYKQFPYRRYRIMVTMLTSAVWHGVYAGYYFCIATVPFALMYEDVWVKVLLNNKDAKDLKSKVSYVILLFLKMQMFSYQSIAFSLLEIRKIFRYYNCVYHCIPILYVCLYFIGKFILQQRKSEIKPVKTE